MAQYSLFVLKVPLNTTINQTFQTLQGVQVIGRICFLARCHNRRLNQTLSVPSYPSLFLSYFFSPLPLWRCYFMLCFPCFVTLLFCFGCHCQYNWLIGMTGKELKCAKIWSNRHHRQTNTQLLMGRMTFPWPNQQCQSTEGKWLERLVLEITCNVSSDGDVCWTLLAYSHPVGFKV